MLTLLQTTWGLTVNDIPTSMSVPMTYPSDMTSYQLYPGGKSYIIPVTNDLYGSTLADLTLDGDVVNNPLAVFRGNGLMTISDNVTVNGTLITYGVMPDIRVKGNNFDAQPIVLPSLEDGTGTPYPTQFELPVFIAKGNLHVYSGVTNLLVQGSMLAKSSITFLYGTPAIQADVRGTLITNTFNILGRPEWDLTMLEWQNDIVAFNIQKDYGEPYFPNFMHNRRGLDPEPAVKINPPTSGRTSIWHDWTQPVYTGHADDGGALTWQTLGSTNNPDATAPTVGGGGALTISNITDSAFTVSWTAGADNVTKDYNLMYRLYASSNAGDVADTAAMRLHPEGAYGTSYSRGITSLTTSDLAPNTTYYLNIELRDDSGRRVAYTATSALTLADITPPVVGDNGSIATSNVTQTSATMTWTTATDLGTAQGDLEYWIFAAPTSSDVSSISNMEATPQYAVNNYTAGITSFELTELTAGTTYYLNFIVRDQQGNKSKYATKAFITLP